ncbi:MAG TPA: V-type ATP synthase subunit K [Atopostipes sp.]|nr:V-type ATP synthase subunit K [Atopostipes sp.]
MENFAMLFGEQSGMVWAALGAALAFMVPGIGSAIGSADAGEAAAALSTEEPDKFGQALILQTLPASQGLYGFVIGLLIVLEINAGMAASDGLYFLMAALPITIAGYPSARGQGRVAVASFQILAKQPDNVTQGLIYGIMVEMFAVLAFVGSLLLILFK